MVNWGAYAPKSNKKNTAHTETVAIGHWVELNCGWSDLLKVEYRARAARAIEILMVRRTDQLPLPCHGNCNSGAQRNSGCAARKPTPAPRVNGLKS